MVSTPQEIARLDRRYFQTAGLNHVGLQLFQGWIAADKYDSLELNCGWKDTWRSGMKLKQSLTAIDAVDVKDMNLHSEAKRRTGR